MRNRLVPVIAAALTAAIASGPAFANDPQSNSFVQAGVTPVSGDEVPEATLGTWIPGATIPVGVVRYASVQCLGENLFYTISGVATGGVLTTANQRYNATTNTWATLAALPVGSEGPTGICVGGKIYVAGGSMALTTLFIYDIATNAWTTGAPVPRPVVMAHMGNHQGRIYLIGGDSDFQPANGVSNAVNIYDIATNTWLADGATMPTAAVSGGYAQIGTFVYVVGGWGVGSPGTNVNQTQRYDMATNTWTVGPVFTSARGDLVTAGTGTALYAIGGDNNAGDSSTSPPPSSGWTSPAGPPAPGRPTTLCRPHDPATRAGSARGPSSPPPARSGPREASRHPSRPSPTPTNTSRPKPVRVR